MQPSYWIKYPIDLVSNRPNSSIVQTTHCWTVPLLPIHSNSEIGQLPLLNCSNNNIAKPTVPFKQYHCSTLLLVQLPRHQVIPETLYPGAPPCPPPVWICRIFPNVQFLQSWEVRIYNNLHRVQGSYVYTRYVRLHCLQFETWASFRRKYKSWVNTNLTN